MIKVRRPNAPHNTNQFLIDSNHCEEANNIYAEHDRLTFDFQHHSMAGSMMDFMSRFSQIQSQTTEASVNHSDKGTSLPSEIIEEAQMDYYKGNESLENIQVPQTSSIFEEDGQVYQDEVSNVRLETMRKKILIVTT